MHEHDEICPTPEGVDPASEIHERVYQVRVFRKSADRMVVRGAVRDQKPPGLYVVDDPSPLTVHHMIVDLEVGLPELTIVAAKAVMERHPYTHCPRITDHYGNLVGMSVARGYTHKVRELFGGPNGCTHTTALLQAMGPAVVQATWSMRVLASREAGHGGAPDINDLDQRARAVAGNLNTCHIWEENGEFIANAREGRLTEMPLTLRRRLTELGRDPDAWYARRA